MSILAIVSDQQHLEDVVIWSARIANARKTQLNILCWAQSPISQFPLFAEDNFANQLDAMSQRIDRIISGSESNGIDFPIPSTEVTIIKRLHPDVTTAAISVVHEINPELMVAFAEQKSDGTTRTNLSNPLLRQSPCATLILHRGGGTDRLCRRVMVAVSDGANDLMAVSAGQTLVSDREGRATIVRFEDDPGKDAMEVGKRELRELLRAAHIKKKDNVKTKVILDRNADEFLAAAEENDLLLIPANSAMPLRRVKQATSRPAIGVIKRAPPLRVLSQRGRARWLPPLNPPAYADLIQGLRRDSKLSPDFVVMLGLAAAIASLGLLQDSPAVVIGSMLLAPLMTPMIGCGLALAQANPNLGRTAIWTIFWGFMLTLVISWIVGVVTPGQDLTSEVMARGNPNILDLLVAVASGAAAAFALARPNIAGAVAGVAISTALVPPLCSVGISLAYGQYTHGIGAAILFITNLVAITLSAAGIFRFMGVTSMRATAMQRQWVARVVGVLGLVILALFLPLHWSLEKSVLQGKPQPGTYPLSKSVHDAVIEEVEKTPGLHLVAGGRPSSAFETADVVLVLAGAADVDEELADRLIAIVRNQLEDESIKVEVYCLQNMWFHSSNPETQ